MKGSKGEGARAGTSYEFIPRPPRGSEHDEKEQEGKWKSEMGRDRPGLGMHAGVVGTKERAQELPDGRQRERDREAAIWVAHL